MFIATLAQKMGKNDREIREFLINAPEKYKVFTIPKRKHGYRIIAQPSRELKVYQRQLEDLISFPVHYRAMAYCKGRSIKINALHHVKNSYLLKLDLENFFNSITPDIFWKVWSKTWDLPCDEDRIYIEKLIFWRFQGTLRLSVGAPSSPLVSNFCMYYFDEKIEEICLNNKVSFTRYADDLTFSSNVKNILFEIPRLVQDTLENQFHTGFSINTSKTIFSSRAHNRHVTGITLDNTGKISLGRDRKRYIKHKVHHYTLNILDEDEINHLRGLIAFAKYIEPVFFHSLEAKYTANMMSKLLEGKDE
ncbi:retron St85 family RNA-directed DNA polymerase [Citrobacter freundii]|uniref:retron St85 family RNA-directed DNA polymerase n=1 Tax=Citrobacter freundii TaxID=546 RepID=UPI001A2124C9|nr:retron St85 family RNA-directed DNA polymerase [Citrobacter freundii]WHE71730.1 retron St85 family RNA-directed DNA polymerase [Citrobacter freundii]WHE76604.1 retron St85 family RNA-directed DNA polymerase [Citrobacter freundii]HAT3931677.1 RNA-directed DNA polymerase [Citrobacter freundii]HAT3936736.1 RNA-directed DNA polymerase [Citrobacter freundii]